MSDEQFLTETVLARPWLFSAEAYYQALAFILAERASA